MDTKSMVSIVIGAVVIAGGSFYGGMQYANQSRVARVGQGGQNGGQFFFRNGVGGRTTNGGGGFAAGTILSRDASSITIQLGGPNASSTNGSATGSKIILVNASTQISKFAAATQQDLAVGDMVTVQGSANSDGSITAQTIQLRPGAMGPRFGQ